MIEQLVADLEDEASPDAVRTLAVIARGTTSAADEASAWLIKLGFGTDGETGEALFARIEGMSDQEIAERLSGA